jgi:multidrug efflux pump
VLARFFVDRPIFAWVISLVIVLLGGAAAFVLPIAQYPDITPPTVQVTATYPGANAKVVADSVAAPVEQQVVGVENMMYMSSQCTNDGAYTLTITFELGTDLNTAQVLVQNRVALAMPQLPPEVQIQGVNTKKKSPSILLVVNLFSPDNSFDDLYLSNYATIQIRDELQRLKGVGDVTYLGQRDYSMRVWLDPKKMAARNLTTSDVVGAVQNQNVQVAAGLIGRPPIPEGQQFQYTMSTLGRLEEEKQFGEIIVKTGGPKKDSSQTTTQVVRLRDVGRIELGAQQYDQIARLDGQATVGLAIFQLPGSNALDVAKNVKNKMKELKKRFPQGLEYEIAYDTTPFIDQSVHEVFKTLIEAIILVAIVVLFFLQDWKAMILPMVSVPVSLIGACAVMQMLGFTLNNLTLFGLVLAIGIVVDDAIMVLENIERLMATGLNARDATIKSMDELTGPIIAITLVLCAVFLPSAFLPGITGQFFRQFALTIAGTMIISAINALTVTPAVAVVIFKTTEGGHGHDQKEGDGHGHEHKREALPWWSFGIFGALLAFWIVGKFTTHDPEAETSNLETVLAFVESPATWIGLVGGLVFGWFLIRPVNAALGFFFTGFNYLFDLFTAGYGAVIGRLLRGTVIALVVYGGLLFLTVRTLTHAPTGFIPMQDQGYLLVNVQLPDSASVERTSAVMTKIERMCLGDDSGKYKGVEPGGKAKHYPGIPGVAHALSISGQSFLLNANGSNFGSCFVILDPFKKREGPGTYDEEIAQKLRQLCAEDLEDAVVTVFRAPPIQGLGSAGGFKLQTEQRGFVDYEELQRATDEVVREGNKDKRLIGLFSLYRAETPQLYVDIDRTKSEQLHVDVSQVFNTLQVYMGGYFVNLFNKFGRTWQVTILAEAEYRTQVEYIKDLKVRNKEDKMVPLGTLVEVKSVGGPVMVMRYNMYLSAAVNGNTAPGVSSGDSIKIMDNITDKAGVPSEWTEITYLQIQAGNLAIIVGFGLGTLLVYLVLAAKYESWKLPLAILLVVPMCLLCAVVGMLIAHLDVNIFVQIGLLVLVGMAAKNAILIVEFAEQLHKEGKSLWDATVDACRLRLRPIVMTSFAFILGVVPLVVGKGAGAEMRQSLGTAVFSGMIGVTFFGVVLTPVFYYALMYFAAKAKKEPKALPVPVSVDGPRAAAITEKHHHPEGIQPEREEV